MKKIDLAVVLIIPLFVFISVFLLGFKINYFQSLLLFFGIPSLYLSLKSKEKIRKVAPFSFLVSIPIAIIFELVAFGDKAWTVPYSILHWRLLGIIPLEDYMWMFLVTYTILIFYEHFCNNSFQKQMNGKVKTMVIILYSLTIILIALFFFAPYLLSIPYSYLWAGIALFVIPTALFLSKYPLFFKPFLKVSLFFFYIHMLFELVGLKLQHWTFTGKHFIALISIAGFKFPAEELVFVMIFGGFACCAYYVFFTDKKL